MTATNTQPVVLEAHTASQAWRRFISQRLTIYLSFVVFALIVLFPFYYIFVSSITPRDRLFTMPPTYFPENPTFQNYLNLGNAVPLLTYFRNSLIFAVGSAGFSVLLSALAAYALARIRFPGRNVIYLALVLSIALPQMAVLVPMFQAFQTFRLVNTHHGLIILMSSLMLPFTILSLVSFVRQVPEEIEEAAFIDGASSLQVLMRIVFPLIRPAMVTMFLINFIISWNELLYQLVFAPLERTRPLSVGLIELNDVMTGGVVIRPWDMMSAMSVVMIIPILLLVLFGQRMIISGLARGAIK